MRWTKKDTIQNLYAAGIAIWVVVVQAGMKWTQFFLEKLKVGTIVQFSIEILIPAVLLYFIMDKHLKLVREI